jgi:Icc-related predicted phosphoesterase
MRKGQIQILALVDIHWSGSGPLPLPALSNADLVLLGGDITHFRGMEVARRLVDQILAAGLPVLAVCGNCDQPEVEDYLTNADIGLDRRARVIEGVKFVGLSGGLPFGGCPYERTEEEFDQACHHAFAAAGAVKAEGPTIFVSHQPPYNTRCDLTHGRHVGSHAVRAAIEQHQPDLVLCGHIHEGIGTDHIGISQIVNPGPWNAGRYAKIVAEGNRITAIDLFPGGR